MQDQTFENNVFKNILISSYHGHCAKSDLTKVEEIKFYQILLNKKYVWTFSGFPLAQKLHITFFNY